MGGLLPNGCSTVDEALDKYHKCWESRFFSSQFWPYIGANEALDKQFKVLQHMVKREGWKAEREG
jgi:hypothetical protein